MSIPSFSSSVALDKDDDADYTNIQRKRAENRKKSSQDVFTSPAGFQETLAGFSAQKGSLNIAEYKQFIEAAKAATARRRGTPPSSETPTDASAVQLRFTPPTP